MGSCELQNQHALAFRTNTPFPVWVCCIIHKSLWGLCHLTNNKLLSEWPDKEKADFNIIQQKHLSDTIKFPDDEASWFGYYWMPCFCDLSSQDIIERTQEHQDNVASFQVNHSVLRAASNHHDETCYTWMKRHPDTQLTYAVFCESAKYNYIIWKAQSLSLRLNEWNIAIVTGTVCGHTGDLSTWRQTQGCSPADSLTWLMTSN